MSQTRTLGAALLLAASLAHAAPPVTIRPPGPPFPPVPPWQHTTPAPIDPFQSPPSSTLVPPQPSAPSYSPPAGVFPLMPRDLRESEPRPARAQVEVRVPPGAEVWFQGVKTRQTGAVRRYESPPLEPGQRYAYDVKARWDAGGKEMERTLRVIVSAGARTLADFTPSGKQ